MREPYISKVALNIGVGESGEKLSKAETLIERLTDQRPVKTYAKVTNPDFGIRKGLPIGVKVTLRKEKAEEILKKAFEAKYNKLEQSNFDNHGNLSFGIEEYIDIPGLKYDPDIGIFGLNVSVTIERPGYRIRRRKLKKRKPSKRHQLTKEIAVKFIEDKFGVIVEE